MEKIKIHTFKRDIFFNKLTRLGIYQILCVNWCRKENLIKVAWRSKGCTWYCGMAFKIRIKDPRFDYPNRNSPFSICHLLNL